MKRIFIIILSCILMFSFCGCTNKAKTVDLNGVEADSQPGWNIFNQPVAKGENGYYYIKLIKQPWSYNIYYMDSVSRQTIPLCNKPDCDHKNTDCNSYIDIKANYHTSNIYYYKNNIYLLHDNGAKGLTELVRISADGSVRETVFEVGAISAAYKLAFGGDAVYI